jgi:hypothetical protein
MLAFIIPYLLLPWHAFALSILWGWFAVPLGLPPVGLWHAAGLRIVYGTLTGHGWIPGAVATMEIYKRLIPENDFLPKWGAILLGILSPAIAIAIGWVVHLLMVW